MLQLFIIPIFLVNFIGKRFEVGITSEKLFNVVFDGVANSIKRQVVGIVTKRVLYFKTNFFNAK
jgi:hypothetical protein